MVKSYTINVDIIENLSRSDYDMPVYNQGDINAAVLNINIAQDGNPYDLTGATVSVYFQKSDGKVVYQDWTNGLTVTKATSGNISVNLTTQTLTAVGKVIGAVKIINGMATIETGSFTFMVKKSLTNNPGIPSSSDLLQALIKSKSFVATDQQTVFDLSDVGSYTPGQNRLFIDVGGVPQPPAAYNETNSTSFTLSEAVPAGTDVNVRWIQNNNIYVTGHNTTHEIGGGDAIDVTKLVNYQEQIATPISNITQQLTNNYLFLYSPNGTKYKLSVTDAGALSITTG